MSDDLAIVSTSVNAEPEAYRLWAKIGTLVVAGDLNSPPELGRYVESLGGVYLSRDRQNEWSCSQPIRWRKIQRRNLAILEAIRGGYEFVVTVDDDNIPLDTWERIMMDPLRREHYATLAVGTNDWWDPCVLLSPQVHHRGFPYPFRRVGAHHATFSEQPVSRHEVAVVAGLWLGDPDVDATERLCNDPKILGATAPLRRSGYVLAPRTWAPFNSQNTVWRAEYASLMMCWPYVGRFDDIWASYLARRVLDDCGRLVEYVRPSVRQRRNDHDPVHDLEEEIFGYRWTLILTDLLRSVQVECGPDPEDLRRLLCAALVEHARWLPHDLFEVFAAWNDDVTKAWKERS